VLSFASLSGAWLLVFDISNGFLGHRRLQEERERASATQVSIKAEVANFKV
jgi:hypothetical protein